MIDEQESREDTPIARARRALLGLSVGDAFGERFFRPDRQVELIERRVGDEGPWPWTDDTAMALEIVEVLERCGGIDPDLLARRLLLRWVHEPARGYGGGAHRLFREMAAGEEWSEAAGALFGGQGSFGNGAAMRVAPVGAYFADDLDAVVEHARRSAGVTHAHPEGEAGAIAVAVAAAMAWRNRESGPGGAVAVLEAALERTPAGLTRQGLEEAARLPLETSVAQAAARLGNGAAVSSQDTVPFCVWSAMRNFHDYEAAMWETAAAGGDRDTTCAIVGGVVALSAPEGSIPAAWVEAREPLSQVPSTL